MRKKSDDETNLKKIGCGSNFEKWLATIVKKRKLTLFIFATMILVKIYEMKKLSI